MEEKLYIEKLLDEAEKTYDEEMRPLIIKEAKTAFQLAIIEGEKKIFALKKEKIENSLDLENLDIDAIAEGEIAIEDQERKLDKIKELYKVWFGEEFK